MVSLWDEIQLHYRVQCDCIDNLPRTLCEKNAQPGFEGVVSKQGDVIGSFPALCQFCEHQKPLPASTFFAETCRLYSDCKWIEIAIGHASLSHHPNGTQPTEEEKNEGEYNTACENPSGDVQRYSWLNLSGPTVECEKIDGYEGVDTIDRKGDEKHYPDIAIGNICPA